MTETGIEGSERSAYFVIGSDGWIVPSAMSRGPWDPDNCHAGPPTAMLARAMEVAMVEAGIAHQLVRMTVELPRPIPMAGFFVHANVVRSGKSVTTLTASLVDAEGLERISAQGMALRTSEPERSFPTPPIPTPDLSEAVDGPFPIRSTRHDSVGFGRSVETRFPPGEGPEPGPTTAWIRTVALVEGEAPSSFQRICPLADSGNAFSRNAEMSDFTFINPDLTIVLHRSPEGEWLGSQSVSHWQPNGIGLADALLFDHRGVVGRALQTLLVG